MRGMWNRAWRAGLGGLVMAAMVWPAMGAQLVLVREVYRLCEALGIMDPAGALGGQIAGFNYQRSPGWVHGMAWIIGAAGAFGPPLLVALAIATPGVISSGPALCGRCGGAVRGAPEPRCARCGEVFS